MVKEMKNRNAIRTYVIRVWQQRHFIPDNCHYLIKQEICRKRCPPAGIKSHQFLFELKNIYFAVFKTLMG